MFKNRFGQPDTKASDKENEEAQLAAQQPGRIDYDTPLSADTIFKLINSSM